MTIVASPPVSDVAKVYRTLAELRAECLVNLGMGSQGAANGVANQIVNSHLRTAQKILYVEFDWHTLIRYQDITLQAGDYRIDYPTFMDAERLLQVAVNTSSGMGTSSANWREVKRGFPLDAYNTQQSTTTFPRRFEQYDRLEFDHITDRAYTLRLWGIRALPRFTEDGDRALIDDDLVLLWAMATLKAHYKKPDAQVTGNQVEKLRVKLRSKSWKQRVFDPNLGGPFNPDWEPLAKPIVVGR